MATKRTANGSPAPSISTPETKKRITASKYGAATAREKRRAPKAATSYSTQNTPDAVDDKYSSLVDETIERIKNDNGWTTDEEFKEGYKDNVTYYTYSFYDSPLFLRYDSTLDKDEVGNKYTSYTQSSYTEGVAYLYYEDSETAKDNPLYTMFVDYSYTEVSVTADSTDTDDSTDDTTDDTNDMNMWLLISSLVIAIALFIAMIGLLVQKLVKKFHLKKARGGRRSQCGFAECGQAPLLQETR